MLQSQAKCFEKLALETIERFNFQETKALFLLVLLRLEVRTLALRGKAASNELFSKPETLG